MRQYCRAAHLVWIAPLIAGCATIVPVTSRELCDARTAMARTEASPSRDRAPTDLEAAREALAIAERAERSAPGTRAAKDLAYVAQRKAERARLEGLYGASLESLAGARETAARLARNLEQKRKNDALEAEAARIEEEERATKRVALREALDQLLEIGAVVEHEADRTFVDLPAARLFYWKKAGITERGAAKLAAIVRALEAGPPTRVTVIVVENAGGLGADAALLAQRRVQRVEEFMRARGVFSERIVVEGRVGPRALVRVAVVEVRERPRTHEMSVANGAARPPAASDESRTKAAEP